ncbi:MAG: hypothetical protein R6U96_13200 [Promethearchaeia archaeon]
MLSKKKTYTFLKNIMVKFLTSADLSHQPSLKEESFLKQWNGFSTTHNPKICPPANA